MKYRALVVDDEPNIVEGLSSQFEQRYADSVIVVKSYSGEHALSVNGRIADFVDFVAVSHFFCEETGNSPPRTSPTYCE